MGISAVPLLAPKAVTRPVASARCSILIPTWNNLPYLRLCVESIRRNSAFPHQVVVHVSDGSDGSLDWVRSEGIEHTWSRHSAGVVIALNLAASRARTAFIVYMDDDVYACPGWDVELLRAADASATAPSCSPAPPSSRSRTGPTPSLRRTSATRPSGSGRRTSSPPCRASCARTGAVRPGRRPSFELWERVGGYSVEFWRGRCSDQDFVMKLWRAGVRVFRGIGSSHVYHFGRRTTSRVGGGEGRRLFARKWGLPASWFYRRVLRMGAPFEGPLPEMETLPDLPWARVKAVWHRYLAR